MPQPGMNLRRSIRSFARSHTDLPRPVGLEISRNRSATIYLSSLTAFEAWRGALERPGDPAEADGWRYVAGHLPAGDRAAPTTLMVRLTEGMEG